ncbi:MAG TPA: helix-hairpin-helix domain-containing protein [Burkholderiaceae bacterium]|nr:helix-hairpin-helix domain-containing protein [Burkholderiaceae bacterium]
MPGPNSMSRAAIELASENVTVADMLRETASLLAAQNANPFRVAAYRKAADTVGALSRSVRELFENEGRAGLDALPSVGPGIASAIAEILLSGRWSQLDRLRGDANVSQVFQTVPGIGEELAQRIHDQIGVDSLESLEAAAHDGRLEQVRGIGPRRASAIRAALTQMLDRRRALQRSRAPSVSLGGPSVDVLLDVDREYRAKAQAGGLPTIAPRRFNPAGESWLPVLHTRRGPWHFTALYSNTAKAHELHREHDWVVVYFYDNNHVERQHTVVTETRGSLLGQRVVRGRETECRELYERG